MLTTTKYIKTTKYIRTTKYTALETTISLSLGQFEQAHVSNMSCDHFSAIPWHHCQLFVA